MSTTPTIILVPLAEAALPLLEPLLDRLPPAERERIEQKHGDGRSQSLCAALLARVLACTALGMSNRALRFVPGQRGKPYLEGVPGFCHSLSHTVGAVAAAVAASPVGVDVEWLRLRPRQLRVADRFFTPAEAAFIRSAEVGRDERFFHVWTRKEACIKMTGQGLATPLSSFDTLTGPWSRWLATDRLGDFVVSCCCETPIHTAPEVWPLQRLLDAAADLDSFA